MGTSSAVTMQQQQQQPSQQVQVNGSADQQEQQPFDLGILGCGTMGQVILNGLLKSSSMVRRIRSIHCSVNSEGF